MLLQEFLRTCLRINIIITKTCITLRESLHIQISKQSLSLSLSLYVYIYMHTHIYIYIYIYMQGGSAHALIFSWVCWSGIWPRLDGRRRLAVPISGTSRRWPPPPHGPWPMLWIYRTVGQNRTTCRFYMQKTCQNILAGFTELSQNWRGLPFGGTSKRWSPHGRRMVVILLYHYIIIL